jgi:hypothetical protein
MGHICTVTMEIAESEIFLHERYANLLEEHPSDATEIERPRLVSFSAVSAISWNITFTIRVFSLVPRP